MPSLDDLYNQFIDSASNKGIDTKEYRNFIKSEFLKIQDNVLCAHEIGDDLQIANKALLDQNVPGHMAEFGCFSGGMSAKLSILAKDLGKKLVIFDSFMGLPCDAEYKTYDSNLAFLGQFKKNQFAQNLETVKSNIEKFGNIYCCEFVEGWIEDTLPNKNYEFSTVFIDVDIIETAQCIIKNIWNKVNANGIFTHESCIEDYMNGILNENWWRTHFNTQPPSTARSHTQNNFGFLFGSSLNYLYKQGSDKRTILTSDSANNIFEI